MEGGNVLIRRLFILLFALCVLPQALAEEDDLFADIPFSPQVELVTPLPESGVPPDNMLPIEVIGRNVTRIEVTADWAFGSKSIEVDGTVLKETIVLPPTSSRITLTVTGYGPADAQARVPIAVVTRTLKTPREVLMDNMIALAYSNSRDRRYNFARAEESTDFGNCKNFVSRLFDSNKGGLRMEAFPHLALHMPLNNALEACKPYQYGIEWREEGAAQGSAFETAAQFRYHDDLSREENRALATAFMHNVQRGDCLQMVGNYVDGNGAHTLLFIANYEPQEDMLRWADSNMKGTRINGERWGYVQFDTRRTVSWMVDAICTPGRGATLYRLRGDLFYPESPGPVL